MTQIPRDLISILGLEGGRSRRTVRFANKSDYSNPLPAGAAASAGNVTTILRAS